MYMYVYTYTVFVDYVMCVILIVATHTDAINKFSMDQLLPREKFHVDAFRAYASGDLPAACGHWVKCTLDHPRGLVSSHNGKYHSVEHKTLMVEYFVDYCHNILVEKHGLLAVVCTASWLG